MRRPTLAAAAGLALLAAGCASGPPARTTLYTAEDLLEASGRLAVDLAASPWLTSRSSASPPARIGLGEMENRSNERLAPVDRHATVARVLISPAMLDTLAAKNIAVVLPPAQAGELERFGVADAAAHAGYDPPTHLIGATFRSITRTAALTGSGRPADARKDYFLVDLVITDADTRRAEWAGTFEFARAARGVLAD